MCTSSTTSQVFIPCMKFDTSDVDDNFLPSFCASKRKCIDFSYGWIAIKDYLQLFQNKIVQDPKSVIQLRATFLKNASILGMLRLLW